MLFEEYLFKKDSFFGENKIIYVWMAPTSDIFVACDFLRHGTTQWHIDRASWDKSSKRPYSALVHSELKLPCFHGRRIPSLLVIFRSQCSSWRVRLNDIYSPFCNNIPKPKSSQQQQKKKHSHAIKKWHNKVKLYFHHLLIQATRHTKK